jgi:hypothetical protein
MKTWQIVIGVALGLFLFMFLFIGGCTVLLGIGMSGVAEEMAEDQNVVVQQDGQTVTNSEGKKIKSATLEILKVTELVANLDKIRVKIVNTGDVSITPQFDVVVTSSSNEVVCEGSPMFGVGTIGAGKNKTDEINLLGCSFSEDGDYNVKVDMLDQDFNKLDSATKKITISYWKQFEFDY